jgi:general secretion pathway protein G
LKEIGMAQHRKVVGGSLRTAARRRGFTLIEVLIVIVIILAIAGLVAVNLFSSKESADKGIAEIDLKSLKNALRQFRLEFNRFPTDEEGIAVLWSKSTLSADADQTKWRSFVEEAKPNDPWGHAWGYRQKGEKAPEGMFDLWSVGPDGEEGTTDDINVWKMVDDGTGSSSGNGAAPPPPPTGGGGGTGGGR